MCGLLASLGQLVIVQTLPDEYEKVMEQAKGWPTAELEEEILGFNHPLVGGALLRSWELPDVISDVVQHTPDPEGLPEDTKDAVRELTCIMHMASLTVRLMRDEDKGTPLARLTELVAERGITDATLDTFLVDLQSAICETAELLDLETYDVPDHAAVIAEAREQMVLISLGTAASPRRLRPTS